MLSIYQVTYLEKVTTTLVRKILRKTQTSFRPQSNLRVLNAWKKLEKNLKHKKKKSLQGCDYYDSRHLEFTPVIEANATKTLSKNS